MKNNTSIINKRREEILHLINENGYANISDLAERFQVSPVTVRRDLDTLADGGSIRRTYGGAEKISEESPMAEMMLYSEESNKYELIQRSIAKKAASMIHDNDIIFINSSLTASYVLEYIGKKRVSIVTNNVSTLSRKKEANTTLILTGGQVTVGRASLTGVYATNVLARTRANICILGIRGISLSSGITSGLLEESFVNQTMIERTDGPVIVVADNRKIGRQDSFLSAGIEMIDTLITDQSANPEELRKLSKAGVNIVFAD